MPNNIKCEVSELHDEISSCEITEMAVLQISHHVSLLGDLFDKYPHLVCRHEPTINASGAVLAAIATSIRHGRRMNYD